jgi:hypothetical protein
VCDAQKGFEGVDLSTYKLYVVKEDGGQTYAYAADALRLCEIGTGEKDEDGKPITITLDTEEKVSAFMPGGEWHEIEFASTVYGEHSLAAQRALLRPLEEDEEAFNAMTPDQAAEYVRSNAEARWPAILTSVLTLSWSFTISEESGHGFVWKRPVPVSEIGYNSLPLPVCRLLLNRATELWNGGNHSLFIRDRQRELYGV